MADAEDIGEVKVPDLGEVDAVTVVEWLAVEGQEIEAGTALVEVETEKTTFVIDAPRSGRLARILKAEGAAARRGEILGEIR
jgi:2-oxoglutarate dehydrogenase E2 component (dihydrolipoamide succinyltransferase)